MLVVENTPDVHNVTVCTLCSCYPWPVLGLPPVWYKSAPYRSRIVIDPRGVLAEFGLHIPENQRDSRLGQQRRAALSGPA
ncbi:Cobalt-containing nitrile hydratase subunit alpha [Klebsiella michiganensis]|nr:Cobalt-containing nitrile hydratase subunit alpha [Klebsiella michiganensis]